MSLDDENLMTDDELDNVVGGTSREIADDSRFLMISVQIVRVTVLKKPQNPMCLTLTLQGIGINSAFRLRTEEKPFRCSIP